MPMQIEQFMDQLNEALQLICPVLCVGRVETWIDAPSTGLAPDGLNQKKVVYSDGVVESKDVYKKEFRTEEGGISTWIFYPIRGEFCEK